MKRAVVALLCFCLFVAANATIFAQGRIGRIVPRTQVQFGKVEPLADRTGVLVRWEMSTEADVVGYYIFRSDSPDQPVNARMIVGSAGKTGLHKHLLGEKYQYFDPNGGIGSVYEVRSYGTNGSVLSSGSVRTKYVRDIGEYTGLDMVAIRQAPALARSNVENSKMDLPDDLQQVVQANEQQPDLAMQRWVVAQPGAKINVRNNGLIHVTRSSLQLANFPVDSDSTYWRLFLDGVEQPIIVGSGNQFIEFIGKALDTPETDNRAYYLINDTNPGARIKTKMLTNFGGNVTSSSFPTAVETRERNTYLNTIFDTSTGNYWGSSIGPDFPASISFSTPGIAASQPTVNVTLKLRGQIGIQHRTTISINGHSYGTKNTGLLTDGWTGTFPVNVADLNDGNNTIELVSGSPMDYSLFDSISVDYDRKYVASSNRLAFFTPNIKRAEIEGFSSANVRIFDTTFEGDPQLIGNVEAVQKGNAYSISLPASRAAVYYAVENTATFAPSGVIENHPSDLAAVENGADMLIISYSNPDFLAVANDWAQYRAANGVNAKVVDVADIYDEFSYGAISSQAIQDFLNTAAHNWQTKPRYVLLLGDASYDPRNYEGFGFWDLLPTKMVQTVETITSSDDALVDFDGDGLADLSIGRIPARNADDLRTALVKTQTFELPANQTLSRGVTLAYDVDPATWNFKGTSEDIKARLGASTPTTLIDRTLPDAHASLIHELNSGRLIVNYTGHGSSGFWANNSFFGIPNVPEINNTDKPTIFTMLSCLNGYFIRPDFESLSETILRSSTSGAAAAWASTGNTTPDVQETMADRFFDQVAAGQMTRLGDLVRDAKASLTEGQDVKYSWELFGDPMLQVRTPAAAPSIGVKANGPRFSRLGN